ncbi:MAG: hypothetical protein ACI9C3_002066, partial [Yoonia sp.]
HTISFYLTTPDSSRSLDEPATCELLPLTLDIVVPQTKNVMPTRTIADAKNLRIP